MPLIPLFAGGAFIEIGGDRYRLEVGPDGVLVSGGVLARAVPIDDLVDLVLVLGAAEDELIEHSAGGGRRGSDRDVSAPLPAPDDEQPTAACPRCQHESHEVFQSRCCARCGYAWRAPSEPDDFDVGPRRAGGGR